MGRPARSAGRPASCRTGKPLERSAGRAAGQIALRVSSCPSAPLTRGTARSTWRTCPSMASLSRSTPGTWTTSSRTACAPPRIGCRLGRRRTTPAWWKSHPLGRRMRLSAICYLATHVVLVVFLLRSSCPMFEVGVRQLGTGQSMQTAGPPACLMPLPVPLLLVPPLLPSIPSSSFSSATQLLCLRCRL